MHLQFTDTRLYVSLLGNLVVPLVSRDLIDIVCWSHEDDLTAPGDVAPTRNTSL